MKDEKNFSPFYSAFLKLCEMRGVSPSTVAKSTGISSGAPTAWKNGAVPKPAQRKKLCDYFSVSDNVLLGYEPIKASSDSGGAHISSIDELKAAFLEGAQDLPQEDRDELWDDAWEYYQFKLNQKKRKKIKGE